MEPNDDDVFEALRKIREMNLRDIDLFPLSCAVSAGIVELIQEHLDNGAQVNESLLIESVLSGEIEAVKLLLKNGADPQIPAGNENFNSNEYTIEYLINKGTDLNLPKTNFPSLLLFALQHDEELFIELLNKDTPFDVNVRCPSHFTLLLRAADKNNMKIVQKLVDYGAKIDLIPEFHYSPLVAAVANGNLEMVNFFLDHGASMYSDKHGLSPISNAIFRNNFDMVKLLLNRGIDVNVKYGDCSITPIYSICDPYEDAECELEDQYHEEKEEDNLFKNQNQREILKLLLDNGANVNSQDFYGSTALHKACGRKCAEYVQMLLTKGIDFDSSCNDKCIILHSNKCKKIWKIVELRKRISTTEEKDSHLFLVDASKTLENLKRSSYFLGNNVDVDIKNKANKSAIYLAVERESSDIVENLFKYLPIMNGCRQ